MIPLVHDFTDERVLVFGGGSVGARRARRFAEDARVVVVSPTFADADFGAAARVRAAPSPDAVEDWIDRTSPVLVVAATDDPAVNEAIESVARARAILVNRADEPARGAGSVDVPATIRDGPVLVAISTGGASPTLSRYLRTRMRGELTGAGTFAGLLADVRTGLRQEGVPAEDRLQALRRATSCEGAWEAIREGDHERARELLAATVDETRSEFEGADPD